MGVLWKLFKYAQSEPIYTSTDFRFQVDPRAVKVKGPGARFVTLPAPPYTLAVLHPGHNRRVLGFTAVIRQYRLIHFVWYSGANPTYLPHWRDCGTSRVRCSAPYARRIRPQICSFCIERVFLCTERLFQYKWHGILITPSLFYPFLAHQISHCELK